MTGVQTERTTPPERETQEGEDHTLEIASSFLAPGYTARCSCGWVSLDHPSEDEALRWGRRHQEEAR